MNQHRRFVVLDRDGVINRDSDDFIKTADEWVPIENSLEAIALLNEHGYEVVVITNQSGIARGLLDEATLTKIHEKLQKLLSAKQGRITAIYYCPHGPDSACECRKPKPGLFRQFANEHEVDLTETYSVGDSLRDIRAAQAVGARPVLVKTGKGADTFAKYPNLDIPVFENLYDATKYIVSEK